MDLIIEAMHTIMRHTCIQFISFDPRAHSDYVYIKPGGKCSSLVGRHHGQQIVTLSTTVREYLCQIND